MPNIRKEGKTLGTYWAYPHEHAMLKKLAQAAGMSVTEYIKLPVTRHYLRHPEQLPERFKNE